jgi:hypothetical protein
MQQHGIPACAGMTEYDDAGMTTFSEYDNLKCTHAGNKKSQPSGRLFPFCIMNNLVNLI